MLSVLEGGWQSQNDRPYMSRWNDAGNKEAGIHFSIIAEVSSRHKKKPASGGFLLFTTESC